MNMNHLDFQKVFCGDSKSSVELELRGRIKECVFNTQCFIVLQVQQQKERHNQEIERQHQNYKPQYGTKIYNNQLIKGITVTIEPLSKEQRAQAEQRRMINDVFSQVESISKLKPSFTNLPQDNQKLPLLQINSPVSFKHNFLQRQSSLDPMSVKMAKQLYSNSQIQPDFTQKNQQAVASQVFGLTQQPSQQAQIQQQQQYNQQQQQIQLQQKKNSQLNNPFSISNQAQSQYQNQQPKKINAIKNQEQNSFDGKKMKQLNRFQPLFYAKR